MLCLLILFLVAEQNEQADCPEQYAQQPLALRHLHWEGDCSSH